MMKKNLKAIILVFALGAETKASNELKIQIHMMLGAEGLPVSNPNDITREEFERMNDAQKGKCSITIKEPDEEFLSNFDLRQAYSVTLIHPRLTDLKGKFPKIVELKLSEQTRSINYYDPGLNAEDVSITELTLKGHIGLKQIWPFSPLFISVNQENPAAIPAEVPTKFIRGLSMEADPEDQWQTTRIDNFLRNRKAGFPEQVLNRVIAQRYLSSDASLFLMGNFSQVYFFQRITSAFQSPEKFYLNCLNSQQKEWMKNFLIQRKFNFQNNNQANPLNVNLCFEGGGFKASLIVGNTVQSISLPGNFPIGFLDSIKCNADTAQENLQKFLFTRGFSQFTLEYDVKRSWTLMDKKIKSFDGEMTFFEAFKAFIRDNTESTLRLNRARFSFEQFEELFLLGLDRFAAPNCCDIEAKWIDQTQEKQFGDSLLRILDQMNKIGQNKGIGFYLYADTYRLQENVRKIAFSIERGLPEDSEKRGVCVLTEADLLANHPGVQLELPTCYVRKISEGFFKKSILQVEGDTILRRTYGNNKNY